jgi:hypothetical protein
MGLSETGLPALDVLGNPPLALGASPHQKNGHLTNKKTPFGQNHDSSSPPIFAPVSDVSIVRKD